MVGFSLLLLNAPHIRAVDPGIIGRLLLRNAALYADPAHIPGHKRTSVHAQRQPFRRL